MTRGGDGGGGGGIGGVGGMGTRGGSREAGPAAVVSRGSGGRHSGRQLSVGRALRLDQSSGSQT